MGKGRTIRKRQFKQFQDHFYGTGKLNSYNNKTHLHGLQLLLLFLFLSISL
jgi:hypothetical protein